MKIAWTVVLVSALTDLGINVGTGLAAAMVATGMAVLPNRAVIVLCLITGLVTALRTIQQALKTTPETVAALKGEVSTTVSTTTISSTPETKDTGV